MASKCHEGDGVIPAPRMWPREPHGLPRAAPAPHSPLASARASAVAPVALSATVTCTRDCVSSLPGPAPRRARAEKPPPRGGGSRPSTRMGFWGTVLRGGLGRACPQLHAARAWGLRPRLEDSQALAVGGRAESPRGIRVDAGSGFAHGFVP